MLQSSHVEYLKQISGENLSAPGLFWPRIAAFNFELCCGALIKAPSEHQAQLKPCVFSPLLPAGCMLRVEFLALQF